MQCGRDKAEKKNGGAVLCDAYFTDSHKFKTSCVFGNFI